MNVFICSGGLDSSIMTAALIQEDDLILSFDYGQKHAEKELKVISELFRDYNSKVVNIQNLMEFQTSALLEHSNQDIPEGKYDNTNVPIVEVRNRNLYFILIASTLPGVEKVFYGAHANDSTVYPDCRPDFVRAAQHILTVQDNLTQIAAPFINMSKGEIVKWGANKGLSPEFMGLTYSCYKGRDNHCGVCPTCLDRKEAFQYAGIEDKTEYEN